jgi:DMSO reductase anchor subunit
MSFFSALGDKLEAGLNKIGLELVTEWRKFYTMYSVWFFAIVGAAPDLYNLALQSGLLTGASAPPQLAHLIALISFFGAASRLVKQKKLDTLRQAASDATDTQSAEAALSAVSQAISSAVTAAAAPPVAAAPQTPAQPAAGVPPPAA